MAKVDNIITERRTAPDTSPLNIAYYFLQQYVLKDSKVLRAGKKDLNLDLSKLSIVRARKLSAKYEQYEIDLVELDKNDTGWYAQISISFDDNQIEVEAELGHEHNGFLEKVEKTFKLP